MNRGKLRKKLMLGIASLRSGGSLFSSQSAFADWYKEQDKHGRHRIRKAFASLEKDGLIQITKVDGKTNILLTDEGHQHVLRYKFDDIQIVPRPRWDGKWRMVLVDIPESKKNIRNLMRSKFKNMGLYPLQRSVWIYPHECEPEITLITKSLGVYDRVRLAEVKSFDGEKEIGKHFGIA